MEALRSLQRGAADGTCALRERLQACGLPGFTTKTVLLLLPGKNLKASAAADTQQQV